MCKFDPTINTLSECTNAISIHSSHFIEISCAIKPENGFIVVTLQGETSVNADVLVPDVWAHELTDR